MADIRPEDIEEAVKRFAEFLRVQGSSAVEELTSELQRRLEEGQHLPEALADMQAEGMIEGFEIDHGPIDELVGLSLPARERFNAEAMTMAKRFIGLVPPDVAIDNAAHFGLYVGLMARELARERDESDG
jgi:hypothetical protein